MWYSRLLFSHTVMSNSSRPHGLQHARLPCPSPSPGAYSNSCPSSRGCHPTISSSVILFSCLQSFPASGSFPVSWFFTSGSESIGVSASAWVLLMNIQDWFPLGFDWLDILEVQGFLKWVLSNTTVQKHHFFSSNLFYDLNLRSIHDYWKSHSFDYMDICWQFSLCFLICYTFYALLAY